MSKFQDFMQKSQKILMFTSLVFLIICLGATIWAASVLHDSSLYLYAAVFVLAIIWFSVTIYRSFKKK
jgi:multisubunit Na+/H+ antiporter MnhG subunit